jgi:hypothetical protein
MGAAVFDGVDVTRNAAEQHVESSHLCGACLFIPKARDIDADPPG